MIQRIQSLYFLLTTFLSFLFLKGSFLKFINNAGTQVLFRFNGIFRGNTENEIALIRETVPVSVTVILIMILSLFALFLFKKRKIQKMATLATIVLTIFLAGLLVYYSWSATDRFQYTLVPGFRMFIPLLILLFEILAFLGIKKDDKLVSSYDRLR